MNDRELPNIKAGDTVRVVIEGEASCVDDKWLSIGPHAIKLADSRIQEVHVTPKPVPLKVGDVIGDDTPATAKQYDGLPEGAVVGGNRDDILIRVAGGFIYPDEPARVKPLGSFFSPRTIRYLPTTDS